MACSAMDARRSSLAHRAMFYPTQTRKSRKRLKSLRSMVTKLQNGKNILIQDDIHRKQIKIMNYVTDIDDLTLCGTKAWEDSSTE
jgi:lysophospholipid acyltransferase (LPLAT)-like uncharacterized protein